MNKRSNIGRERRKRRKFIVCVCGSRPSRLRICTELLYEWQGPHDGLPRIPRSWRTPWGLLNKMPVRFPGDRDLLREWDEHERSERRVNLVTRIQRKLQLNSEERILRMMIGGRP